MTAKPDPLLPAHIDLRDFPFMPMEVARLRKSRAWSVIAKRDPRLGFYMQNLWCESWHERPAGSMPDDDDLLCELAMCSDIETWKAVKAKVMHGWILCSDGRWYHPTVCEKAEEAWSRKQAQRDRTAAAREARAAQRRGEQPTTPSPPAAPSPPPPPPKAKPKQQEAPHQTSFLPDPTAEAVDLYNAAAERAGLPKAMKINDTRKTKLKQRINDAGGLEGWKAALAKLEASPHCTGNNDRGWRADLDFLLHDKSFTRLMEGSYDARKPAGGPSHVKGQTGLDRGFSNVVRLMEREGNG
jgi:hypothetical protein